MTAMEGRVMRVRLRVGNLGFDVPERMVHAAFGRFGIVQQVELVTDPASGRSLGFALVTMGDEASARSAIAWMDGAVIGERVVRVEELDSDEVWKDVPRRVR
jgi:RNA recognition motif-containing protein